VRIRRDPPHDAGPARADLVARLERHQRLRPERIAPAVPGEPAAERAADHGRRVASIRRHRARAAVAEVERGLVTGRTALLPRLAEGGVEEDPPAECGRARIVGDAVRRGGRRRALEPQRREQAQVARAPLLRTGTGRGGECERGRERADTACAHRQ
jgi:hypothetical protein